MIDYIAGNCYYVKNHENALIMILGQEPPPHEFIIHASLRVFDFHINFLPVHKDILDKELGEFVGRGSPNQQSYESSVKAWTDKLDADKERGYRTFFTVPVKNIFEYAAVMYQKAKGSGCDYRVDGKIVLPAIFPY